MRFKLVDLKVLALYIAFSFFELYTCKRTLTESKVNSIVVHVLLDKAHNV